jgi:hypothetical protein
VVNRGFRELLRLLKNSPAPASDPLFSANGTIFEASEPDLTPPMALKPTFSTGSIDAGSSVSRKATTGARQLSNSTLSLGPLGYALRPPYPGWTGSQRREAAVSRAARGRRSLLPRFDRSTHP